MYKAVAGEAGVPSLGVEGLYFRGTSTLTGKAKAEVLNSIPM